MPLHILTRQKPKKECTGDAKAWKAICWHHPSVHAFFSKTYFIRNPQLLIICLIHVDTGQHGVCMSPPYDLVFIQMPTFWSLLIVVCNYLQEILTIVQGNVNVFAAHWALLLSGGPKAMRSPEVL